MRVSPAEYLSLPLRAHELLHDIPLYDVSAVDLRAGEADAESQLAAQPHRPCVRKAEKALTGQAPNAANIERAAGAIGEVLKDPLSDSYASGEFRVHLATVMTKRALMQVAR